MKFTLVMILGLLSLGAFADEQASQDLTGGDCQGKVSTAEGVKDSTTAPASDKPAASAPVKQE